MAHIRLKKAQNCSAAGDDELLLENALTTLNGRKARSTAACCTLLYRCTHPACLLLLSTVAAIYLLISMRKLSGAYYWVLRALALC
jgi:hypothetical protein